MSYSRLLFHNSSCIEKLIRWEWGCKRTCAWNGFGILGYFSTYLPFCQLWASSNIATWLPRLPYIPVVLRSSSLIQSYARCSRTSVRERVPHSREQKMSDVIRRRMIPPARRTVFTVLASDREKLRGAKVDRVISLYDVREICKPALQTREKKEHFLEEFFIRDSRKSNRRSPLPPPLLREND